VVADRKHITGLGNMDDISRVDLEWIDTVSSVAGYQETGLVAERYGMFGGHLRELSRPHRVLHEGGAITWAK